jgi:hypothetical protein
MKTAATFIYDGRSQLVSSGANRRPVSARGVSGSNANWGTSTPTDLNAANHAEFLIWNGDSVIMGMCAGTASQNTAGAVAGTQCSLDGTTTIADANSHESTINYYMNMGCSGSINVGTEGFHFVTFLAYVAGGGTGTWNSGFVTSVLVNG